MELGTTCRGNTQTSDKHKRTHTIKTHSDKETAHRRETWLNLINMTRQGGHKLNTPTSDTDLQSKRGKIH